MSRSQDHELLDIPAPGRSISSLSSNSRMSHDSGRDVSNQDPFTNEDSHQSDIHPSQPYDSASVELLSNAKGQDTLYDSVFIDGWGWELAAWLLSAVSTVTLLTVFAMFANKSLRSWNSTITPAAVVAILSQFGQTAILAPVTACICQSMWLWLHKESRTRQPSIQVDKHPQLISMQQYDGGSRGPLGSLFLLFKNPGSYGNDFPPSLLQLLINSRILVWLGTIDTFLIILFGTFAQQTLQLPTRQYNLTDPAAIPRSLQYRASQPAVQYSIRTPTRRLSSLQHLFHYWLWRRCCWRC